MEYVNQSNNDNKLLSASPLLSFTFPLTNSDSYTTPYTTSSILTRNDTNSILFTDIVVNTTTVAIDYATQWLSTTIATTVTNLTSINKENAYGGQPITFSSPTPNDIVVADYKTTASLDGTYNATNIVNDFTYNRPTTTNTYTITADDEVYYHECHYENPNFNCSRMDYVVFSLGPQRLPIYKLITIIYGVLFFGGIIGNLFVCFVIFKHRSMHTATNYYLFNLAVSDLIYLIFGLPPELILYWHQYPYLFGMAFCKIRAYISEASTYVSVLTIVAFSMERYLAICHPLYLHKMSGFKRALYIIVALWLISTIAAIPFFTLHSIQYLTYPPDKTEIAESGICAFDTPEKFPLFEVSSLFSFFVPMFSMFYFYGRMGIEICSTTTQQLGVQQGSLHGESKHQQSRKAVIRMLAVVVVTFFICWLPFHIQRLWYVHGKGHTYYQEVNEWLFSMTGCAYYLSCTINPILYNVMSHRYRLAFLDILCRKRRNAFNNNGYLRDQSSFRETTIVSSLCNNSIYHRSHSIREHSLRIVNNSGNRSSIKSNNFSWKNSILNKPTEKDIEENQAIHLSVTTTNAVVVCGANGRTNVFTENEVQKSLLNKNNETSI